MKLNQLIEYDPQIFFEKSYTIWAVKLVPNSFLKNQNWTYLRINSLKFYTVFIQFVFIAWLSRGLSNCMEIKVYITCFYLI